MTKTSKENKTDAVETQTLLELRELESKSKNQFEISPLMLGVLTFWMGTLVTIGIVL